MITREDLAKLGYSEEDLDMVTRYISPPNARGESVCCEVDGAFRWGHGSWYVTKPNGGWTIPTPADVEALAALMQEMGIKVQP